MRRRRYRRKLFKVKLRKETIYSLSSISMILSGLVLFFSFTKNGEILNILNLYLTSFFGIFSLLIPTSLILFGLLFTRIGSRITRPNVPIGFLTLTISVLGLFQSGIVGEKIFNYAKTLLSEPLSFIVFLAGICVGFIVFLNLSIFSVFNTFHTAVKLLTVFTREHLLTLFKTKREIFVKEARQIAIKGLKGQPAPSSPTASEKGEVSKKKELLSDELVLNKPLEIGVWEYPPISLLSDQIRGKQDKGDIKKTAAVIEKTLESFGIKARVVEINVGPSVTQYALEIALGTKLSKITALTNDLALATEAPTGQIRIEAPIPGRSLVGIEIPNKSLDIVSLKTMLESYTMQKMKSKLTIPLGLDVSGNPVIADITRMPHILVAGTTGSGKSVLLNSFICSLLFRASPTEIKMILIDPKRVELTGYNSIPHLLVPVVVDLERCISALKWALKEMDRRYIKFSEAGVRNIDSYNELSGFQAFPFIVIIIDELADLMSLAPVEVEDSVTRLAQMARATGIHLVLSTQRPSVDVLTGLIKANIPCRIAFNVASMIDSKVIIDTPGAEKLLGRGDMLYIPPDQAKPTRIQGTYVSEQDVKRVINFIRSRGIPVHYTQEVVEQEVNIRRAGMQEGDARDPLLPQVAQLIAGYDRASISLIQRKFSIGFNRAARIMEQLEALGIVSPGEGSKPRDVRVRNPEEILSQV